MIIMKPLYGLFVRLNAPPLSNVAPTCIASGYYKEMLEKSSKIPGSWVESLVGRGRDRECDEGGED